MRGWQGGGGGEQGGGVARVKLRPRRSQVLSAKHEFCFRIWRQKELQKCFNITSYELCVACRSFAAFPLTGPSNFFTNPWRFHAPTLLLSQVAPTSPTGYPAPRFRAKKEQLEKIQGLLPESLVLRTRFRGITIHAQHQIILPKSKTCS